MKKFLFVLFGVFAVAGAFAAGDNIPTSKSYVDAAVATKQDKISANDGVTQVLTNTGTAGEYGTKGIYDANGEYATQAQSLVDAATMNAGVQNAIDSEFQCIEWLDPNDHTSDCLLMDVFGTPPQQILPTGFTALEYIENSGRQYIDTLISGNNNNLRIITKFNLLSTVGGAYNGYYYSGIFGNYTSETSDVYRMYIRANQQNCSIPDNNCDLELRFNTNTKTNTLISRVDTFMLGTDYIVDMSQNRIIINGDIVPFYNDVVHASVNNKTIKLFAGAVGGDMGGNMYARTRIYYFSLYNGATLVRNFIPARRDSDGKIGMYDTVTNTFFTNAGTGEFIGGPVVNLYLPSGN